MLAENEKEESENNVTEETKMLEEKYKELMDEINEKTALMNKQLEEKDKNAEDVMSQIMEAVELQYKQLEQ